MKSQNWKKELKKICVNNIENYYNYGNLTWLFNISKGFDWRTKKFGNLTKQHKIKKFAKPQVRKHTRLVDLLFYDLEILL